MNKKLFSLFLFFNIFNCFLYAEYFKIKENKFLVFDENHKLKKEISLGSNIKYFENIDKYVILITNQGIYVTDKYGKLYSKKLFIGQYNYLYKVSNNLIFKKDTNYYAWTVLKDGTLKHKDFYFAIDSKKLFFSKTKSKDIVVFTENYLYIKNLKEPIIPFYLSKNEFWYFDKNFSTLYKATTEFYRKKEYNFPKNKIYSKNIIEQNLKNIPTQHIKKIIKILSYDDVKKVFFKVYMKKARLSNKSLSFLFNNLDANKAYLLLVKTKLIKKIYLGNYNINQYRKLLKDIKNLKQNNLAYRYILKNTTITCNKIQKTQNSINLKALLVSNTFFDINDILLNCSLIKKNRFTQEGYNTLFLMPVSYYKDLYENRIYKCNFSNLKRINLIKKLLLKEIPHLNCKSLQKNWEFKEKKYIKNITSKKTAFGEALTSTSKSSNLNCNDLNKQCKRQCETKENELRLSAFSSSDRYKCKKLCNEANYYCKKGNSKNMKVSFCSAQCIGFSEETHLLGSSNYDKCFDKCLNNFK